MPAYYLWIQIFYSALNDRGRSGFVMVVVGSNFFYTVTLPCTLWFLDRGKVKTPRKDKVLFLDAEARELEGRISENVEKLLEAG